MVSCRLWHIGLICCSLEVTLELRERGVELNSKWDSQNHVSVRGRVTGHRGDSQHRGQNKDHMDGNTFETKISLRSPNLNPGGVFFFFPSLLSSPLPPPGTGRPTTDSLPQFNKVLNTSGMANWHTVGCMAFKLTVTEVFPEVIYSSKHEIYVPKHPAPKFSRVDFSPGC